MSVPSRFDEITAEQRGNIAFGNRLRETYGVAIAARHGNGSVSIHVGRGIWERLRAIQTHKAPPGLDAQTLWGFPIVLEEAWEPGAIQVKTTLVVP